MIRGDGRMPPQFVLSFCWGLSENNNIFHIEAVRRVHFLLSKIVIKIVNSINLN